MKQGQSKDSLLKTFFFNCAESKTRALIHFLMMTSIAGVMLSLDLWATDTPKLMSLAGDKLAHLSAGKTIGTLSFYFLYLVICFKVLFGPKDSMTSKLLWIPTLLLGVILFAASLVVLAAFGKEAFDGLGFGNVEWADIVATLDGAYAPNIKSVALLMGLTSALVPLDLLLQLPEKMTRSKSSGKGDIDSYLREVTKNAVGSQVLLVEDDIACASIALKFCHKLKLSCTHVDTIAAAKTFLDQSGDELKWILLDIFVRVENAELRMTGADFLKSIEQTHPKGKRSFSVVILSGYPEALGKEAELADKVMAKPWSPQDLKVFLQKEEVV